MINKSIESTNFLEKVLLLSATTGQHFHHKEHSNMLQACLGCWSSTWVVRLSLPGRMGRSSPSNKKVKQILFSTDSEL